MRSTSSAESRQAAEDRERKLEIKRRSYRKHRAERLAYRSEYAKTHKEQAAAYRRQKKRTPEAAGSLLFWSARNRAKRYGLVFSLEKEEIISAVQRGTCEVTGLPFVFLERGRSPWAPSLDRRDPAVGYTAENTRVVVNAYNIAKCDWSHSDLMKLAKAILESEAN